MSVTTCSFMVVLFLIITQLQYTQSIYCKSNPHIEEVTSSRTSKTCHLIKDPVECIRDHPLCIWDSQGTLTNLVGPNKLYSSFRIGRDLIAFPTEEEEQHIVTKYKPRKPQRWDRHFLEQIQQWTSDEYLRNVEISQVDFYGVEYILTPNPDYQSPTRRKLVAPIVGRIDGFPGSGRHGRGHPRDRYPFQATGVLTFLFCADNRAGQRERSLGECVGSVIHSTREPIAGGGGNQDFDYILTAGHCCRDPDDVHTSCGAAADGGLPYTPAGAVVPRFYNYYSFNFDFYQNVNVRWSTEQIRVFGTIGDITARELNRRDNRRQHLRTASINGINGATIMPAYIANPTFVNDWCVLKLQADIVPVPANPNQHHLRIEYNDNWTRMKFLQPTYDFHHGQHTSTTGQGSWMQRVIKGEVRDASRALGHGFAYWYRPYTASQDFKIGMSGSPIVKNVGDDPYNAGAQWQIQIGIAVGTADLEEVRYREDVFVRFNRAKFNLITGQFGPHLANQYAGAAVGAATATSPAKTMDLNLYNYNNQQFYNEHNPYLNKYWKHVDDEDDYHGDGYRANIGYKNEHKQDKDKDIERMEIRMIMKSFAKKHKMKHSN